MRETLTVVEAARVLGISRNSTYEAVRTGSVPSLRIGRRIVVPAAALRRLLDSDLPGPGSAQTPAAQS